MPELVGAVSEHWVCRYIAGTEHNEKKYTGRIKYVAKRHEHYIAKLQQGFQSHTGKARDTLFRFTLFGIVNFPRRTLFLVSLIYQFPHTQPTS